MVEVYKRIQPASSFSTSFIYFLFMFAVLTSLTTMVIGTNIARAFGLIGAMSIIRFRNAIKSPLDTAFIFWGLVVGMSCGSENYHIAIAAVLIGAVQFWILEKLKISESRLHQVLMRLSISKNAEKETIRLITEKFNQTKVLFRLINKIMVNAQQVDYIYLINTESLAKVDQLHAQLQALPNISQIKILEDDPLIIND